VVTGGASYHVSFAADTSSVPWQWTAHVAPANGASGAFSIPESLVSGGAPFAWRLPLLDDMGSVHGSWGSDGTLDLTTPSP
jgi:hypothetical protein